MSETTCRAPGGCDRRGWIEGLCGYHYTRSPDPAKPLSTYEIISPTCPNRITFRAPIGVNALAIESGTPTPRCKLKWPSHWPKDGVDWGLRWRVSGGNELVFGHCSGNCPRIRAGQEQQERAKAANHQ